MRGKGACVLPHRELYVNTSGDIAKCTRPKGDGFANFIKNASGKVGTPDACDFNCKPTFKKNEEFRTCDKQDVVAELPKDRKSSSSPVDEWLFWWRCPHVSIFKRSRRRFALVDTLHDIGEVFSWVDPI